MIKTILEKGGIKTGVIGTLGVIIGDTTYPTNNTTPESYDVQKYLNQMVEEGCQCAVMEASSLGLKWHRTDGLVFDYGVFTNFSSRPYWRKRAQLPGGIQPPVRACCFKAVSWGL